MHLLASTGASLDEVVEPVDLGQSPADVAVLSFTDSDLAAVAAAWRAASAAAVEGAAPPTLRLASLRDLKHPLSVDLWIERVGSRAKVVVVRLLGGLDYWRYGVDRLAAVAREHGIALAVLPGEDQDDPRLADASTLPPDELARLTACFRAGGPANMAALLRRLARLAGRDEAAGPDAPVPLPRAGAWLAGIGPASLDALAAALDPALPVVPIVFYRSMLLADDVAPVAALAAALAARGIAAAPLYVASLKEPDSAAFLAAAVDRLRPAAIVTTTAFAAAGAPGAATPLDRAGVPVFQAVVATTRREAWAAGGRGLGAADLAMHVVLPELDGRILAGTLGFKAPLEADAALGFTGLVNRSEPDRVEAVADRVAAWVRLAATPPAERRVAVLIPDYAGPAGRTGYAVGLDVPASVLALLADLRAAGYAVDPSPRDGTALMQALARARDVSPSLPLADYAHLLPAVLAGRVAVAWGAPADDPDAARGAFGFRALDLGNVIVAVAPDRGLSLDRRADYHDPALPPRHALVAFGLWLRHAAKVDAIVHMGAHGTLEWLPGKAVALTAECFPEVVAGPLPVIYPFIASNPGEAAQAKRRIAAVTLGHLPPPTALAALDPDLARLERLVDEYAAADGLDPRRRDRLARLVREAAEAAGLAAELGLARDLDAAETLKRIDGFLCDLKELALKDGLHVYGRPPPDAAPAIAAAAAAERRAILDALAGRRIAAGPAGAPARGRQDVLPTGRNLFTADPRTLPTPTASDLGRLAADEILRRHLQEHGDYPRALVLDLWGSATLRTGGEEIAQALALMGCRATWDAGTGRVTGIEVLPPAVVGRPRVDVTVRISGLFRDLFPTQIALLDAAVRAVAARAEEDGNPLAEIARAAGGTDGPALARVFGTAPGTYGTGIEDALATGRWEERETLGAAYLAATSHAFRAAEDGEALPGRFAARVAAADLIVHPGDDPGRDLLDGAADVAALGGFAAAVATLGRTADLVVLDTTDPARPRARGLAESLARLVRGRVDPRFVAGQMRHGWRGAAELAETVDRLVAFAETTEAVPGSLLDRLHAAYAADPAVRDFLLAANPEAARTIARRLADARRRGLWHPRRNAVDADLAVLSGEVAA